MSEGILFNILDPKFAELGGSFSAYITDYPDVVSGEDTLEDPDAVVIPVKTLTLKVSYPLNKVHDIAVSTENPRGFTRQDLFRVIHETYVKIFDDPRSYGVWGHHLEDLVLEGAFLTSPHTVELAMGS